MAANYSNQSRPKKALLHKALRYTLAGGSLLFGVLASFRTDRIAALMGEDEEAVRHLGMRDLRSGVALLSGGRGLGPLIARLRYDIGDAISLLRKKPSLAPLAIAAVVVGLAAIITRE